MNVPGTLQNSLAGPPPVDDDRCGAPGNTSQRDHFTVGLGKIFGLSHAMDSSGTGAFGCSSVSGTDPLDQGQYQSENNRLRLYMPDAISDGTGPPRKRLCLGHPINVDVAVPMQNYEDQTTIIDRSTSTAGQGYLHSSQGQVISPSANTTSVPTSMASSQQNDALGEDTRQDLGQRYLEGDAAGERIPTRNQTKGARRYHVQQIDNSMADGGSIEGEVNDSYVTTKVATNNPMQLMNYQQLLATSESSMAQSPFGAVSIPYMTHYQTEDSFIQQDYPNCPASTGILQPPSSHENQYSNMVATNEDLQWPNPDDMTMIPSWPLEDDMTMIPSWQFEDGLAMARDWTNWNNTDINSASTVALPSIGISQSTARHDNEPP